MKRAFSFLRVSVVGVLLMCLMSPDADARSRKKKSGTSKSTPASQVSTPDASETSMGASPESTGPQAPAAPMPAAVPAPTPEPAPVKRAASGSSGRAVPSVVAASKGYSWTRLERLGVSLDVFTESSQLTGEQWINSFRSDESFQYGGGPLALSIYGLVQPGEHWRFGPGIRFLGNHGSDQYGFGFLTEGYFAGEFSLRAFEKVDAVFGMRVGLSVLVPRAQFKEEIRRLQAERADVWALPRLGVLGGLNLGVRRQLLGKLYGRVDFSASLAQQWLFATDDVVDRLRFQKSWASQSRRLGATFGLEVAF